MVCGGVCLGDDKKLSQCVGFQLFRSTALIWFLELLLSLRPLWSNRSKQQAQQKICSVWWEGFLFSASNKRASVWKFKGHTLFQSSKQHCCLAVTVILSGKSLHKQQQKSVIKSNKRSVVITWEWPTQQACLSKYVRSNRNERKASFILVLVGGCGVCLCVWGRLFVSLPRTDMILI